MANFRRGKTFGVDSLFNQLAQVHLFIARFDIGCRNVSNHAGNARKGRCCAGVGDQHVYQTGFRVGLPGAILVALAEPGSFHKDAGVELHFVGLEGGVIAKTQVVGFIRFWCGTQ